MRKGLFLENVDRENLVNVVYWASLGKINLNFRNYKMIRYWGKKRKEFVFKVHSLR